MLLSIYKSYSLTRCIVPLAQEWTKLERFDGAPWPMERKDHAACCLSYKGEHPQLLVTWGAVKSDIILSDGWILDVKSGKWREVSCNIYINVVQPHDSAVQSSIFIGILVQSPCRSLFDHSMFLPKKPHPLHPWYNAFNNVDKGFFFLNALSISSLFTVHPS